MTIEEAKTEIMQIYGSLSEEKKKALDVAFKAMEQADNIPVMYYPQVDGITPTVVAQTDGEKTCGTCRNEDTYHCAECENKSDYEQSQADGEYISKQAVIEQVKDWMNTELRDKTNALHYLEKRLNELPSVPIPPEHDGCKDCKHEIKSDGEYPCSYCKQNYKDMWEMKEPTDTITMTREEFSEKLMEHYRQGRADEKAYQNGEIMQSFNPD